GSAEQTCASADRHPNFGSLPSDDLSRSQRLRNSHDLSSRYLHIEVDLASSARLPVSFHHTAFIVHVPRSGPVGPGRARSGRLRYGPRSALLILVVATPPGARFIAPFRRAVEPLIHAPKAVQSAPIGGVGVVDDTVLDRERAQARPLARVR